MNIMISAGKSDIALDDVGINNFLIIYYIGLVWLRDHSIGCYFFCHRYRFAYSCLIRACFSLG